MIAHLTPIANRSGTDGAFQLPADNWYHIVPRGEFPHPESGKLQVLDESAMEAMVNRFVQDAKSPTFGGLLIDQEHFSYDPDKSSEAFGWIHELQNRDTGLWARVQWTDAGLAAVKNGRYRFISPSWIQTQVQHLPNNRIRPLRLDTAGLTNSPNLRGMVPLSNRRNGSPSPADNPNPTDNPMKSVAIELGLSADASEEAILAEVKKLRQKGTDAEAKVAPMTNRITDLEKENTSLKAANQTHLETQVDSDIEKYSNRFAPEKKDHWRKALLANRADAIALLESIPAPAGAVRTTTGSSSTTTMHNRATAQTPNGTPGDEDAAQSAKAAARAKRIANRAQEIMKAQRVPFSQAFNMAKGEMPAEA